MFDSVSDGVGFCGTLHHTISVEISVDYIRESKGLVEYCLRDCGINMRSRYVIVLVGGSTRTPKFRPGPMSSP